jgi:hypothetical protein
MSGPTYIVMPVEAGDTHQPEQETAESRFAGLL